MRLGILGGMGPVSSLRLYQYITELTPAKKDQDHIEIIIASLPKTPDRTEAILGKDNSTLTHLII